LPAIFLLNLISAILIRIWPEIFLAHNAHVWLIAAELLGFAGYLVYVVRFYVSLAPLIAEARHEWRGTLGDRDQS
jgi:thiosulfate reductase cytochrome b subunit